MAESEITIFHRVIMLFFLFPLLFLFLCFLILITHSLLGSDLRDFILQTLEK